MVNVDGARFVDERQDFSDYIGRVIPSQLDGFAFQVWDAGMVSFLRKEEYNDGVAEKSVARSVEELAEMAERAAEHDTVSADRERV